MTDRETDASVAMALGWTSIGIWSHIDQAGNIVEDDDDWVGVPPGGTQVAQLPRWRTYDADAVGLLAEMTRRGWGWDVLNTTKGRIECLIAGDDLDVKANCETFVGAITEAFLAACEKEKP